jgi:transposase InsO family protein
MPIRRMEMTRPGELVHVDIKKLGRIPKGGGWRAHGRVVVRGQHHRTKVGYAFVHSAVDAHTRIAYSEVLVDEQGRTAAEFWTRAAAFYRALGIVIERVLTDNGPCYKSHDFNRALGAVQHTFTRAYRPQTNGKVERFNRTLLAEWAYARPWTSEGQRNRALAHWLHLYNHHRHHTAIGGPPISRINNLDGQHN